MRAVDTNVLVRLLTRDDAKQTAAAETFVSRGAWVSHLDHRDLALQDPDVVEAALLHYRKRSKVGFSECMVLEVARKAGHLPLGTFDRQFSKLEGVEAV